MLLLKTVSELFKDAMPIYFDHNCLHLTFKRASLSKEIWCKMAETKHFLDYIFKKMKNVCNMM